MMYVRFIEQMLDAATTVAREKFGKVASQIKEDDPNQVLTEADTAIGELLVSGVQREFPHHSIIDEEAGVIDKNSRYTWVIDPIDGTSNFAAGLPHYGVMIGLLEEATPIAGGIALPAFHEVYVAEKGHGATCNGAAIHVAREGELANSMLCYGIDVDTEHPEATKEECLLLAKILLEGSYKLRGSNSAYDIAMVARGNYGVFLNRTSKIWDNVAPQIIVEEAGGRWTAFDGTPIDYSNPLEKGKKNFTHCGASPETFQHVQAVIHDPSAHIDWNLTII